MTHPNIGKGGLGGEAMISVKGLVRRFGNVAAVDHLSFEVGKGEVVGFVGANGAGKTTTLRMLATLDIPDAGEIQIAGVDALDRPDLLRGRIGWMPDSVAVYPDMTVLDYLDFFARAAHLRGPEREKRLREVMHFTDLLSLGDRDVRLLSKGMGQRLCLARTLLHDPDVLLLDEPAAGLDPKARIEFRNLVDLLASQGKTVLISSHILSELGEMCDTLLFIDRGRVVRHSTMDALISGEGEHCEVEIGFAGTDLDAVAAWFSLAVDLEVVSRVEHRWLLRLPTRDREFSALLLRRIVEAGLSVCEFRRPEKRLEQVFVEMVKSEDAKL